MGVGVLGVAIAACGGDDPNNNPGGVCGDGRVDSGEQCDDGNTAGGDGCNATCATEPAAVCGDDTVTAPEQCDDGNTTSGDGCSMTCTSEAPANGTCDSPFDLTFTAGANDTHVAAVTGDTMASTSQVGEAPCDGFASGAGKDHVYRFTIAEASDVEISTTDATEFDAVIRVMTAPCDVATEVSELGNADGCSDADDAEEYLYYVALPAGTYYIVVDGYDDEAAGAYELEVTTRPTACGDGVLDDAEPGWEVCDDDNSANGDGCNSRCEVEPTYTCDGEPSVCTTSCGDGTFDTGEECDDGNATAGDRCSSTCTLESTVTEIEPNDTTAQPIAAASQIIRGSFDEGDIDLYTFTLTIPARVDIETYDAIDLDDPYEGAGTLTQTDCIANDTIVTLGSGTTVVATDDDDGDDTCSYLGPQDSDLDEVGDIADPDQGMLQPGTYTIRVEDFDGIDVAYYILDIEITPSATSSTAGTVSPGERANGTAR